jgi:hypothetical protein
MSAPLVLLAALRHCLVTATVVPEWSKYVNDSKHNVSHALGGVSRAPRTGSGPRVNEAFGIVVF